MNLHEIALRVLFGFIFLFMLLRLSGKRTIGEATSLHFVLAIMIGEMFDDLAWGRVAASQFIVAAGALVTLHIALEIACDKSKFLHRLIIGDPAPVVTDGRVDKRECRSEQLNGKAVAHLLRVSGIDPYEKSDVRRLTLEIDGQPSLLRRGAARAAQQRDTAGDQP